MKQFSFDQAFMAVSTVAVIGGVIAGFWVLGSPGHQRLISADRQRIQDIYTIVQDLYWEAQDQDNYTLPETLSEDNQQTDPFSKQPYEYERLTATTYQLCAEFATDTSTYPLRNQPQSPDQERWEHPEGRHCFEFDVTKEPPLLY